MTTLRHIGWVMLLAAGAASAGELNVRASRTTVGAGELFYVLVEAQGESVASPSFEDTDDFSIDVRSPSMSTSRSIEMVNGQVTTTQRVTWRYVVSASREGTFVLPRVSMEIDGKVETGPAIVVTVGEAAPVQQAQGGNRGGGDGTRRPTVDDIVLIDCDVDKREVYQGERLTLTWTMSVLDMRRVGVRPPDTRPSAEGFYEGPVEERRTHRTIDGLEYEVYEWRQALYATGSGDYTIGRWPWNGVVEYPDPRTGFTVAQRRSYVTDSIEVKVLPLPPRPEGFTGAVGRFELRSSLLDSQVVQGVPTTLVVRVTGEGNSDAIGAPEMPALDWGHVSDAETSVRTPDENEPEVIEKTFEYRITPREAGTMTIPPIRFVHFSPEEKRYVTLETPARQVQVEASDEDGQLVVIGDTAPREPSDVRILGEDVLAIVKDAGRLRARGSRVPATAALVLLPPAVFAGLFTLRRRQRRFEEDSGYARRHFAKARAVKRMGAMDGAADPVAAMHGAVTQYLADALGGGQAGLTWQDARDLMAAKELPEDLSERFVKVLRACERGRYGGAALSAVEVEALRHTVLAAVDEVERRFPKEGR